MNRLMSKIITTVIAVAMLATIFIPTVNAEDDTQPPLLQKITFIDMVATTPGILDVTATATDDRSGVATFFVNVCAQGGNDDYTVIMVPTGSADEFHGTIDINKFVDKGECVISEINIFDKAGNRTLYQRDSDGIKDLPPFAKAISFKSSDGGKTVSLKSDPQYDTFDAAVSSGLAKVPQGGTLTIDMEDNFLSANQLREAAQKDVIIFLKKAGEVDFEIDPKAIAITSENYSYSDLVFLFKDLSVPDFQKPKPDPIPPKDGIQKAVTLPMPLTVEAIKATANPQTGDSWFCNLFA